MTINVQSPFLITSRKFQEAWAELEPTLSKSYTEIAQAVNFRTIGLYELTQINTGNKYFNTGDPQNRKQSYRKLFSFGAIAAGATLNINHGLTGVTNFVQIYGTCHTDAPDSRPIPYVSTAAVNQQIQIRVTSTQIVIINGAGANNITDGIITLEYLLN